MFAVCWSVNTGITSSPLDEVDKEAQAFALGSIGVKL